MKFQAKKPSVHTLHTEMFTVTQGFLFSLHSPWCYSMFSASSLSALDFESAEVHLPCKECYVGKYSCNDFQRMKKDRLTYPWLSEFYTTLKAAYLAGAKKLKALPLVTLYDSPWPLSSKICRHCRKSTPSCSLRGSRCPWFRTKELLHRQYSCLVWMLTCKELH